MTIEKSIPFTQLVSGWSTQDIIFKIGAERWILQNMTEIPVDLLAGFNDPDHWLFFQSQDGFAVDPTQHTQNSYALPWATNRCWEPAKFISNKALIQAGFTIGWYRLPSPTGGTPRDHGFRRLVGIDGGGFSTFWGCFVPLMIICQKDSTCLIDDGWVKVLDDKGFSERAAPETCGSPLFFESILQRANTEEHTGVECNLGLQWAEWTQEEQ